MTQRLTKKSTIRPTIGTNPLDAIMPSPQTRTATAAAPTGRPRKIRATFHLTEETFDAVRDCVVALSGPPHRLTLSGFAEDAFRVKLEALQKTANEGKPFPKRDGELRGGRPIGS